MSDVLFMFGTRPVTGAEVLALKSAAYEHGATQSGTGPTETRSRAAASTFWLAEDLASTDMRAD